MPAPWGRVIYDADLYRSWHLEVDGGPMPGRAHWRNWQPESVAICYVQSKDGFEWTQPQRCPLEVRCARYLPQSDHSRLIRRRKAGGKHANH